MKIKNKLLITILLLSINFSLHAQSSDMIKFEWYEYIYMLPLLALNESYKFIMEAATVSRLHYAARKGNLKEVKRLLSNGENINVTDYLGDTPLHYALGNNHHSLIQFLIEQNANINSKNKSNAAAIDHIRYDLSKYEEVNSHWIEILRLLISKGADINGLERPPLKRALENSNYKMANLLLEAGANIKIENEDMIHLVQWFVSEDDSIWKQSDWKKTIKLFIKKGGDINSVQENGQTALYSACFSRNLAVVKFLLANGAKPSLEIPDSLGNTPLHRTVDTLSSENSFELIMVLVQNGANLHVKNQDGETALDIAKEIYSKRFFDKEEKKKAFQVMQYLKTYQ